MVTAAFICEFLFVALIILMFSEIKDLELGKGNLSQFYCYFFFSIFVQPALWMLILINKVTIITGLLLMAAMLFSFYILRKRKLRIPSFQYSKAFLGYYIFLSHGALAFLVAILVLNQRFSSNEPQTILVVSSFCLIAAIVTAAVFFLSLFRKKQTFSKADGLQEASPKMAEYMTGQICDLKENENEPMEIEKINKKDIGAIFLFIMVYGFLVFFRLGNSKMPQDGLVLDRVSDKTNEIILDMGKETEISSLYLHLGYMDYKTVSLSWYDEENREWVVLDDSCSVKEVFNWTELKIDKKVRFLGLVGRNYEAVYTELVILDQEREKLLPVNADRYEKLFNEQELFPEDLSSFHRTMFDEVIYARSLYELFEGIDMYENTHPPLGKIIMAAGVWLFGNNPFGWRFVNALLGVLMIPIFYLFLRKITGSFQFTCFGTALFCLEFMHYTLSRICTIDNTAAFFIFAMFALMYFLLCRIKEDISKERKGMSGKTLILMIICAITTGIAVAVKWTGFYAMAGIAVLFLSFFVYQAVLWKKKGKTFGYFYRLMITAFFLFLLIPLGIYILSYYPMMVATGKHSLFQTMLDNSLFMLHFHETAIFEHPYQSSWYTWIFDLVPLMDSGALTKSGNVSVITTFGNPVIWWSGIAALFNMFYRMIKKRDQKAGYLLFSYISLLAPWFFVGRTVFIYQYYTCSIMLTMMLAYSFCTAGEKWKRRMPLFLEAALIVFIIFYPVISGYPISGGYIKLWLEWLPRWQFL